MRLIKWGLILGMLVGVLWSAIPWGLRWHLLKELKLMGLDSTLADLRIDYLAGDFILNSWEINRQGKPFLSVAQLRIAPDLNAWRAGRLELRKLEAKNLRINWQATDKGMELAGLPAAKWQNFLKLERGAQITSLILEKSEFCQSEPDNEQCWVIGAGQASDLVWRWDRAGWQIASRSTLVMDNTHLKNQRANLAVFLIQKSIVRDYVLSNDWSRLGQWQMNGVHLVERSVDEQKNIANAYQTQADAVLITDLGYKAGQSTQLNLGQLDITRLRQTLHQNKDQVMLATAQLRKFLPVTERFFNPAAPLTLAIGKTRIYDAAIAWRDDSVTPAVSESLVGLNGELGPINSLKPNDNTSVNLVTKLSKQSEFQLRGHVRPFAAGLSLDLQGNFRSIALINYATYLNQLFGETPKSGEFDGTISLSAAGDQLTLNGQVTLTDLRTSGEGNLSRQAGDMTIGRAFEKLRGEKSQLTVDWRFETDLSKERDPIKTALGKSFKSTLLRMIQNDWRSAGVKNLSSMGTNPDGPLSFDAFRYSPNERELSPDQEKRLKDLTDLVNRRPKEKLKLCGISTGVEWSALYHQGVPIVQGTLVADDQLQYLIDLSAARVRSIKSKLGGLGISSNRFISCEPRVEMGTKIMSFVGIEML